MVNKAYNYLKTLFSSAYNWLFNLFCKRAKTCSFEDPELGKIKHCETMDPENFTHPAEDYLHPDNCTLDMDQNYDHQFPELHLPTDNLSQGDADSTIEELIEERKLVVDGELVVDVMADAVVLEGDLEPGATAAGEVPEEDPAHGSVDPDYASEAELEVDAELATFADSFKAKLLLDGDEDEELHQLVGEAHEAESTPSDEVAPEGSTEELVHGGEREEEVEVLEDESDVLHTEEFTDEVSTEEVATEEVTEEATPVETTEVETPSEEAHELETPVETPAEVAEEEAELKMESFEGEDITIPVVDHKPEAPSKKKLTTKLNWEAKASVPKYSLTLNSKLNTEAITKNTVTTKGKAAALMQAQMDKNQTKVKTLKNDFKKELEEKKQADAQARQKIVEAERARVAAAKLKKEKMAEKIRKEAAERYQKEKGEKLKMRSELEAKKKEISSAKVKAIQSSKI